MQAERLCHCGSLVIIFKVYRITGIWKIEFFNFSNLERVKILSNEQRLVSIWISEGLVTILFSHKSAL